MHGNVDAANATAVPAVATEAAPTVLVNATAVPANLATTAHLDCPVEGCGLTFTTRLKLANHLNTPRHAAADAQTLASGAFARCPVAGCSKVLCLISSESANSPSPFRTHIARSGAKCDLAHTNFRATHAEAWVRTEYLARCHAASIATPGSL
jgi:hypothetical protein